MPWCLAEPLRHDDPEEHRERGWLTRFDPRYWTVDFPRPMMAAVTTSAPDALRVDLSFTGKDNLAGLIWEAEDRHDHPLLAYETARDFRRCQLRFRWRSAGVKALDAVWGPVLTIEGRDAAGQARSWYVRLWNYASGSPEDALIALDFGALAGGFLLPQEADPVWAGDIDRMFISLVPPGYDGTAGEYAAVADAWIELSGIACTGSGSVLAIGDAMLPDHGLHLATAYDDLYHLTPARVLRMVEALGYGERLLHYVGMSHFPALSRVGMAWRAGGAGAPICAPALAWHRDLAARAQAAGRTIIWSLSYELFADYCPPDWMQRAADGSPALTGWVPPSALLSPAHAGAMGWLQQVARGFVALAGEAGMAAQFQIGEPWWWIDPATRAPCLYDAAATAALGALSLPIAAMDAAMSAVQRAMLDAAGALLAASTAALAAAVKAEVPGAAVYLLAYLPTILDPAMPEAKRMNLPTGWAAPAFDALQLEDYDWAARGQAGASAAGAAAAAERLGYAAADQHYLAGFVLSPADKAQWAHIDTAADAAAARGVPTIFIWAWPQVARDGYLRFGPAPPAMEDDVTPFVDELFPIAIGREASVTAEFSTAIVTGQSGAEQRAPDWADARMAYDVGPGVRSEADVQALIAFYRARRGPAVAFRFRDPLDGEAVDEWLGDGDGVRTDFALRKGYGAGDERQWRRLTLPVPGSVTVSIGGVVQATGWTLGSDGMVQFAAPPAAGAVVRASCVFDVRVRFAEDRLEVSRATFLAGEIASVPLIEVRG